jgi:hypothetical protein
MPPTAAARGASAEDEHGRDHEEHDRADQPAVGERDVVADQAEAEDRDQQRRPAVQGDAAREHPQGLGAAAAEHPSGLVDGGHQRTDQEDRQHDVNDQ